MKDNSFLKKFQGRVEQIGRNGYTSILNNVHINIADYIPKPKKVKKPRIKIDPYGHISSEISEEFNKNINFMPQTKNLSLSPKRNKTEEIQRTNNNNIKIFKSNNINKLKGVENSKENYKIKINEREKPIKLLKKFTNDNIKNRDIHQSNELNSRNSRQVNNKNYVNSKTNNKLTEPKKRSHSIKLNLKLPSISNLSSSPNKYVNNILTNNGKDSLNKSQDRPILYTPKNYFSNSQIIKDNLKKSYNNGIVSGNGNLRDYEIKGQYNLPKINKKFKNINQETDKKIKLYNKQKDEILSSIKNDFLMLDSIKNKVNNTEKNQFIGKNVYYQNNDNQLNGGNKINNKNKHHINNKNRNYFRNLSDSNDINQSDSIKNNIYNNNKEKNYLNEDNIFEINENKKPHTSFDYIQKIPKLKNKLDIIHEESEDDNNKYITDVKFNNNLEGKDNLNSLEILMKQRAFFQNQIPNNSRFKLK